MNKSKNFYEIIESKFFDLNWSVLGWNVAFGNSIDKEEAKQEYNIAESKLEEANKGNESLEKIKASNSFKRAKARLNAAGIVS